MHIVTRTSMYTLQASPTVRETAIFFLLQVK